jgi:hypothetical protein
MVPLVPYAVTLGLDVTQVKKEHVVPLRPTETQVSEEDEKEVSTRLRLPASMHDALVRESGHATAREGRRVSTHALLLRFIREGLERAQKARETPDVEDDDIIFDGGKIP